MRTLRLLLPAAVLAIANPARADTPSVEHAIDKAVNTALATAGVRPAAQADAATLVRRLTLDLVGRIPTTAEVDAFTASTDADKRAKLVDRLMASPGFARHQAALFEAMLNPDGPGRRGGALGDYLLAAMKADKRWDTMFRELLVPDDSDPAMKGAADFLRARVADTDKLTNDVSVAFFGVNVSCAQCHDHPLVKDWKQDHFFGMKAFLARTFDNGGFVAERGYGTVKFKPTKGPERTAPMMFLTGATVKDTTAGKEPTAAEQKAEKADLDKAKAAKKAPPKPKFSAREKLADVALQPDNAEFFARSIVNRMWHRFLGAGLVNPLDQMHSENPPSHPELLAWLARDTAASGYDLRRLVRGIVMSNTYSRGSQHDSTPPESRHFAVARLRPLTPLQLAASLKIAAADPAVFEGKKLPDLEKQVEQMEASARGFAALIVPPTENFQVGVGEALLFSNGDRLAKEFLTDGPGTLLGRVKTMTEPAEAVTLLVKTVYGRPPTADETTALVGYVAKRADRTAEAYRQVLWALVTGPEFRFTY